MPSPAVTGAPTSGSCAAETDGFPYLFSVLIIIGLNVGDVAVGLASLEDGGLRGVSPQLLRAAFKADVGKKAWHHSEPSPGLQRAWDRREDGPEGLATLSQSSLQSGSQASPWAPGPWFTSSRTGNRGVPATCLPRSKTTSLWVSPPSSPHLQLRVHRQPSPRVPGRGIP